MKTQPRLWIVALAVFHPILVSAGAVDDDPNSKPLEALAQKTLATGSEGRLHERLAKEFDLPREPESRIFQQITVSQEGTREKSLQVRRRSESGRVDIILVDNRPRGVEKEAYFFLTSTHGRLEKAIFVAGKIQAVQDEDKKFKNEVAFWLDWLKKQKQ